MIHFKDVDEVLQILRDTYTYMHIQNKNDDLGRLIIERIERVLNDQERKNDVPPIDPISKHMMDAIDKREAQLIKEEAMFKNAKSKNNEDR